MKSNVRVFFCLNLKVQERLCESLKAHDRSFGCWSKTEHHVYAGTELDWGWHLGIEPSIPIAIEANQSLKLQINTLSITEFVFSVSVSIRVGITRVTFYTRHANVHRENVNMTNCYFILKLIQIEWILLWDFKVNSTQGYCVSQSPVTCKIHPVGTPSPTPFLSWLPVFFNVYIVPRLELGLELGAKEITHTLIPFLEYTWHCQWSMPFYPA